MLVLFRLTVEIVRLATVGTCWRASRLEMKRPRREKRFDPLTFFCMLTRVQNMAGSEAIELQSSEKKDNLSRPWTISSRSLALSEFGNWARSSKFNWLQPFYSHCIAWMKPIEVSYRWTPEADKTLSLSSQIRIKNFLRSFLKVRQIDTFSLVKIPSTRPPHSMFLTST